MFFNSIQNIYNKIRTCYTEHYFKKEIASQNRFVFLMNRNLGDFDVRIICDILLKYECVYSISELWLQNNKITDIGAIYLARLVKNNKNISKIVIHNNLLSESAIHYIKTVSENPNFLIL